MEVKKVVSKKLKTNTCILCESDIDFEVSNTLLHQIVNNDVVIFAGAGVSTERKNCFDSSFYSDICQNIGVNPHNSTFSFSDIMSKFVRQTKGKKELLNQILYRIEYANDFPEIGRKVTEFHKILSNIPYFQDIVTTNWDTFFEEYCDALPIILDKDFVFSNYTNKRKVYKLHGSISSPSTIVATKEDYEECYNNLNYGVLGGHIKSLLATKVIVFVGFSFGDEDLERIFQMLKNNMGDFLPASYIVNLDETFDDNIYPNSMHIKTDACFFVNKILNLLIEEKYLYHSPNVYNYIYKSLQQLKKEHIKTTELFIANIETKHRVMHSLVFQDGMSHAFERALSHSATGKYLLKDYLLGTINSYKRIADNFLEKKCYFDFSYVEGYIAGLAIILDPYNLSYYYIPGYGKHINTISKYKKLLLNDMNAEIEQYSLEYCSKHKIFKYPEHVIHHPPFIF